jgi:hypothetical protein
MKVFFIIIYFFGFFGGVGCVFYRTLISKQKDCISSERAPRIKPSLVFLSSMNQIDLVTGKGKKPETLNLFQTRCEWRGDSALVEITADVIIECGTEFTPLSAAVNGQSVLTGISS